METGHQTSGCLPAAEIGAAWRQTKRGSDESYLRVRLDDPRCRSRSGPLCRKQRRRHRAAACGAATSRRGLSHGCSCRAPRTGAIAHGACALPWRVIVFVLLPCAGGFYLSYLFRSVNALIADHLASEFGIGPAELGLLTSVYLLVTAVAQIPLGIMLDRYGPRRVQGALLIVAAIGALQFAYAESYRGLMVGRALIGLGVATALMAGIKAAVMWVPKERLALANGILLGLGTLGAVTATAPADIVVATSGWRTLFIGLAAVTLASAASLWLLVTGRPVAPSQSGEGLPPKPSWQLHVIAASGTSRHSPG